MDNGSEHFKSIFNIDSLKTHGIHKKNRSAGEPGSRPRSVSVSGGPRIFQIRAVSGPTPTGYYFGRFSPETAWKRKQIEPRRACVPNAAFGYTNGH